MRMILKAYICEHGRVRWVGNEGMVSMLDVLNARQSECRYAIGWDSDGRAMSLDLYGVMVGSVGGPLAYAEPDSGWQPTYYPNLDTAIAATVLRHSTT